MRWKTVSKHKLYWRAWDGETVVYNEGSGDTHLLSSEGTEILHFLSQHPAGVEEVVQHMALEIDTKADETLYAWIEEALNNLDQLGLIEPVIS